jgi:apolipoprotein N-acyltransferase
MVSALVAAISLLAAWLYGQWRLSRPLERAGPTVALVAGTVLGEGNLLGLGELPPSPRRLAAATADSAGQDLPGTIDLFVWPEAAFAEPVSALAAPGGQGAQSPPDKGVQTLQAIARSLGTPVLIGTMRRREIPTPENLNVYNSFLYVSAEEGLLGVYDKWHLIPCIEFPPKLMKWLGSLGLAPLGGAAGWEGLRPGTEAESFLLQAADGRRQFRVGATLCYDVFFPDVHRRYIANGPSGSPDLFVCGLNECFDRTGMVARLSFLHTRLRAIEFRRPYYRVSRGGLSAAVDSCGRVVAQASERDGDPVVIVGQVAGDSRRTIYSTCGDWIAVAASAVVVGIAVVPWGRRVFAAVFRLRKRTVARKTA